MPCDRSTQVHRYHDGELPIAERIAIEAHLKSCLACSELLTSLTRLTSAIRSAPLAEMPTSGIERLKATWDSNRQKPVLRIAEWLTAAAAAVLIGALLTWPRMAQQQRADLNTAPPLWQSLAVSPPEETREEARSDNLLVAQWMADDLETDMTRQ